MAEPRLHIALFALLSLSFLVLILGVAEDGTMGKAFIRSTCQKTYKPDVCVSILEADPRSFKANLTGLARISMELTGTMANDTLLDLNSLFKNEIRHNIKENLDSCIRDYKEGVYYTTDVALPLFDKRKYDEAGEYLNFIGDAANFCNTEGFPILEQKNNNLLWFTGDTVGLLNLLVEGHT